MQSFLTGKTSIIWQYNVVPQQENGIVMTLVERYYLLILQLLIMEIDRQVFDLDRQVNDMYDQLDSLM